jgi:CheY-like chemotaxis protein
VFTLRVPRGQAATARLSRPVPARSGPALDRAVVRCIDNQASILDGMRTLLTGWSCRVLAATGLTEALAVTQGEAARSGPVVPDLVIVDYHLDDGGDGISCLETLRRHFGVEVPAILITADRSEALKRRARAKGLLFLNKPIKPAALRALITRSLAASRAAE